MTIKIIDFPKIVDPRGSLTFLQNPQFIPFEIQRVYWVYNVPLKGGVVMHINSKMKLSLH